MWTDGWMRIRWVLLGGASEPPRCLPDVFGHVELGGFDYSVNSVTRLRSHPGSCWDPDWILTGSCLVPAGILTGSCWDPDWILTGS